MYMQFKRYLLIPYSSVKCVIHIEGYKPLAYKNNYLEKKKLTVWEQILI